MNNSMVESQSKDNNTNNSGDEDYNSPFQNISSPVNYHHTLD